MADVERCVCCGKEIPEGSQVCFICGYKVKKKIKKCKYCGSEIKSNQYGDMCRNCYERLPLVQRLVKLFRVIKRECGVDVK